ncbi:DEAD/DEAH box helicase domain protein [Desulfarculus baarsii DSM 2075]|uniref:DEAD/DEAH box helicase domain protein n=1 Tax=Desulfarculus baarsii (strain ATCC 33931 / DSM 2075 / LMG 7858 / VKM B-1802 / 2st14) TaxID=644282 RepID=E1QKB9_DESB2|nr:ATP-dependent DNA helicase RecG [Desulfarculus baarsii]ADK86012.1 DEAD/DEAH box helicase domain protein [Desulfarculus baarsii DSM 2075]
MVAKNTPSVTPWALPALARSLGALPGVGPKTVQALAARGLRTWGDGLFFLPPRYEDRRRVWPLDGLEEGRLCVARGRLTSSGPWGRRGKVWRMVLDDGAGRLNLLWFHFKKAHLEAFAVGREVFAVGRAELAEGGWRMVHPEVFDEQKAAEGRAVGVILPVYPELASLGQGGVRRFMADLAGRTVDLIPDPLFGLLPARLYPCSVSQALRQAHLPGPESDPAELDPPTSAWRRVLAVNELFYYQLGLWLKRRQRLSRPGLVVDPPGALVERFLAALPFALTEGQNQALAAILADMASGRPMGRLLAGDVGSGKTVVALAAAAAVAEAGAQTALMAPTEVLARQHLASAQALLEPLGLKAALVLGGADAQGQKQARAAAQGGAALLIGTQAMLAARLEFERLGLVIIDEQQRFGVHQRLRLAAKGLDPHLLVLSATPIPRTMALALAGHLDISPLPQLPGRRPKIATTVLAFEQRRQAVEAMAATLAAGEQVYVICPLVEASDKIQAHDAVETHRRLGEYFPGQAIGLLHGRLDSAAQQRALEDFRAGQTRALVATTVVEVGLDVPAATLMIVLGAERFGLCQLHQLRGRVGRGQKPGRCCLVTGPEPGELGRRRLEVLAATADGLAVAEADLAMRGPGQALGAGQAGLPPLRFAGEVDLLPEVSRAVDGLFGQGRPDDEPLAALVAEAVRRWGRLMELVEAG